ncbi:MAG: class E sortase [Rubrobacter sp.]|nr:class E sortase [Rubrobacter sp.]
MDRVEDDEIPVAAYNDEQRLRDYTAIHLEGTGFPWQEEANVYVAGHRLGYPNTDSFLAFYDIDELEDGDEVIVTDANGTEYVYEVFREIVVGPADVHVVEPMEGRNIISLQACTLPDYSKRIIVQAELKEELRAS